MVALGASAVLSPALTRAELVDALASLAQLVSTADPTPVFEPAGDHVFQLRGRVIAVTGPGGTGASTVAMSAAQAVSTGVGGQPGNVVLADLCLRAEQGMLHDSQSVAPGLQELVDAHRSGRPSPARQTRAKSCPPATSTKHDCQRAARRSTWSGSSGIGAAAGR